jgi:hypothetical protein
VVQWAQLDARSFHSGATVARAQLVDKCPVCAYLFRVKPMRRVKPDPQDPDWTFPYATRKTLEKIRDYFESFQTGGHPRGWKQLRHVSVVKGAKIPWASVDPKHRAEVDRWFKMKLNQLRLLGPVRPGKIASLRMNAAYYGRHVLTRKRGANRSAYQRRKRIWLAFQDWEKSIVSRAENLAKPKLRSRVLG